jgi:hypothetical protein
MRAAARRNTEALTMTGFRVIVTLSGRAPK